MGKATQPAGGGDDIYIIEKALGYKKVGKKDFFLIKWKGYSSKHNTWEPAENLGVDKALVCQIKADFLKEGEEKLKKSRPKQAAAAKETTKNTAHASATLKQQDTSSQTTLAESAATPNKKKKLKLNSGKSRDQSSPLTLDFSSQDDYFSASKSSEPSQNTSSALRPAQSASLTLPAPTTNKSIPPMRPKPVAKQPETKLGAPTVPSKQPAPSVRPPTTITPTQPIISAKPPSMPSKRPIIQNEKPMSLVEKSSTSLTPSKTSAKELDVPVTKPKMSLKTPLATLNSDLKEKSESLAAVNLKISSGTLSPRATEGLYGYLAPVKLSELQHHLYTKLVRTYSRLLRQYSIGDANLSPSIASKCSRYRKESMAVFHSPVPLIKNKSPTLSVPSMQNPINNKPIPAAIDVNALLKASPKLLRLHQCLSHVFKDHPKHRVLIFTCEHQDLLEYNCVEKLLTAHRNYTNKRVLFEHRGPSSPAPIPTEPTKPTDSLTSGSTSGSCEFDILLHNESGSSLPTSCNKIDAVIFYDYQESFYTTIRALNANFAAQKRRVPAYFLVHLDTFEFDIALRASHHALFEMANRNYKAWRRSVSVGAAYGYNSSTPPVSTAMLQNTDKGGSGSNQDTTPVPFPSLVLLHPYFLSKPDRISPSLIRRIHRIYTDILADQSAEYMFSTGIEEITASKVMMQYHTDWDQYKTALTAFYHENAKYWINSKIDGNDEPKEPKQGITSTGLSQKTPSTSTSTSSTKSTTSSTTSSQLQLQQQRQPVSSSESTTLIASLPKPAAAAIANPVSGQNRSTDLMDQPALNTPTVAVKNNIKDRSMSSSSMSSLDFDNVSEISAKASPAAPYAVGIEQAVEISDHQNPVNMSSGLSFKDVHAPLDESACAKTLAELAELEGLYQQLENKEAITTQPYYGFGKMNLNETMNISNILSMLTEPAKLSYHEKAKELVSLGKGRLLHDFCTIHAGKYMAKISLEHRDRYRHFIADFLVDENGDIGYAIDNPFKNTNHLPMFISLVQVPVYLKAYLLPKCDLHTHVYLPAFMVVMGNLIHMNLLMQASSLSLESMRSPLRMLQTEYMASLRKLIWSSLGGLNDNYFEPSVDEEISKYTKQIDECTSKQKRLMEINSILILKINLSLSNLEMQLETVSQHPDDLSLLQQARLVSPASSSLNQQHLQPPGSSAQNPVQLNFKTCFHMNNGVKCARPTGDDKTLYCATHAEIPT